MSSHVRTDIASAAYGTVMEITTVETTAMSNVVSSGPANITNDSDGCLPRWGLKRHRTGSHLCSSRVLLAWQGLTAGLSGPGLWDIVFLWLAGISGCVAYLPGKNHLRLVIPSHAIVKTHGFLSNPVLCVC